MRGLFSKRRDFRVFNCFARKFWFVGVIVTSLIFEVYSVTTEMLSTAHREWFIDHDAG